MARTKQTMRPMTEEEKKAARDLGQRKLRGLTIIGREGGSTNFKGRKKQDEG